MSRSAMKKPVALSSKGYQVSTPPRPRSESDRDETEEMSFQKRNRLNSTSSLSSSKPDEFECEESETALTSCKESESESISDLYDEYLLSRLLLIQAHKRRASLEKHLKSEVSNMLCALQSLQAQLKVAQDKEKSISAEKAKMKVYKEILSTSTVELETTSDIIHKLARALESRHARLKVEGGALLRESGDPKTLVEKTLALLSHLKSKMEYPTMHALAEDFKSLETHLSEVYRSWDEFQRKSSQASILLTRLESMKLSLAETRDETDMPHSLLKINVPPPLSENDI